MWVKCDAVGEEVDQGICELLWRPRPTWSNARSADVVAVKLLSFPEFSKGRAERMILATS
jgi:hypothetical protein